MDNYQSERQKRDKQKEGCKTDNQKDKKVKQSTARYKTDTQKNKKETTKRTINQKECQKDN